MQENKQQQGKNETEDNAGSQRMGNGTAHAAFVAGTESLRGNNGQAAGKTERYQQNNEKYRCRRAQGGQCVDTDETADDNDVGNLVELLKKVADEQRQGKFYDKRGGISAS